MQKALWFGDGSGFGDRNRGGFLPHRGRGRLGLGGPLGLGGRLARRCTLAGRSLLDGRLGGCCLRRRCCCRRCGNFGFYGWRRRLTPACPSCRRRRFRRSGVGIVDHKTSSLLRGEAVHRGGLSRRPPPVHPGWPAIFGGRSLSTGSEILVRAVGPNRWFGPVCPALTSRILARGDPGGNECPPGRRPPLSCDHTEWAGADLPAALSGEGREKSGS